MNENKKGRTIFSNNRPVKTDIGIYIINNIGGNTLISGNEFYTPAGSNSVLINDAAWWGVNDLSKLSDGAQYEILGNKFHAMDSWGAIYFANDRKTNGVIDNKNPMKIIITYNLFDLQGSTWGGIWNWITDKAIISNNVFTGQAKTGIYVDPRTEYSLMICNNFTKLVCTGLAEIPGYLTLPVVGNYNILLLGNNNTVAGGSKNGTSVLNLGENNIITGAKSHNVFIKSLGKTKFDHQMILKENMVKMHRH